MKALDAQAQCPCGSEKTFGQCCAVYLQGGPAPEGPEALMRSRYTAFCLSDFAYLKKTWHPDTYPEGLGDDEPTNWIRLEILDSEVNGDEGEVEFRAFLLFENKLETLHEISFFERVEGKWLYHSGDFLNDGAAPQAVAKSAPCPCGSRKAFKDCHFE